MERGRRTVPNAAKDRPFWPPPKTDVRSAPLTRTLPFPMYRTFMAHKYQELSMISLLYYQETLTADGRTPGDQNCYLEQFYIACPTPTGYREFQWNNYRCDAGLPPIRPNKRHSIRRSAQALYIARTQIQSTVRFILF